jgi:hypothetical protein
LVDQMIYWIASLLMNKFVPFTNSIAILLVRLTKELYRVDCVQETREFVQFIDRMHKKTGFINMIKYMKAVRLHVTRYICGTKLMHNQSKVGVVDGFPSRFL